MGLEMEIDGSGMRASHFFPGCMYICRVATNTG
jgi:hypothetical protein